MRVKILRNLGMKPTGEPWPKKPDGTPYLESEEADVPDDMGNHLLALNLAERVAEHAPHGHVKTVGAPHLTTTPEEEAPKAPHHEAPKRGR